MRARRWRPAAAGLADATARQARARAGREALAAELRDAAVRWTESGAAVLDRVTLAAAPPEIAARVLADALRTVGGRVTPPAPAATARLLRGLAAGRAGTLHGCALTHRNGAVWLVRELRNLPTLALRPGESGVWDGRFRVAHRCGPLGHVAALGPQGWRQVRNRARNPPPHPVRQSLPTLWIGGRVAAAPHLGVAAPGVRFNAVFRESPPGACFAVVPAQGYPI